MRLTNTTRRLEIADSLSKTGGLLSRLKGLIGSKPLEKNQALWIPANNSIHTFFMTYAIDVVFTDKEFRVKSIFRQTRPWKLVPPQWGAFHTFELPAGRINNDNLQIGDVLNVGH